MAIKAYVSKTAFQSTLSSSSSPAVAATASVAVTATAAHCHHTRVFRMRGMLMRPSRPQSQHYRNPHLRDPS